MSLNAFTSAMRNLPLKSYVAHGAMPFLKSVVREAKAARQVILATTCRAHEGRGRDAFSGALALTS